MSYFNGQTGYREDFLETRSVVRKNNFVIIEPDGIVKNAVPGYENCDVTILGSPLMGASFADYLVTLHEEGLCTSFGGNGIETFIYVLEGELEAENGDRKEVLKKGGYFFSPSDKTVKFKNAIKGDTKLYTYKRRYIPVEGFDLPETVVSNEENLEWIPYEDMDNCHIKDFLPAAGNFSFDMNFHILKFKPGASHGYIETHIQQHGMYFLAGKGMYRIDDEWIPLKKGDYVFMDAYCPQACYGVGKDEDLIYIYSKDCNRDVIL